LLWRVLSELTACIADNAQLKDISFLLHKTNSQ
jgi:hypothetical protein